MIKFNLSPSSLNQYRRSELEFFYNYILKAPIDTVTEKKYGHFGTAVHEVLEHYPKVNVKGYKNVWEKYDLHKTDMKYSIYLKCINKGISLINSKYKNKECEKAISLPLINDERGLINLKGIIDVVCDDVICDWKTSSRIDDGDAFLIQAKFYAYLIWKRCGRLPKEAVFEYVKINKSKSFKFTQEELEEFGVYLKKTAEEILAKGLKIENYSLGEYNYIFNNHLKKCSYEEESRNNPKKITFVLKVKYGKIFILNKLSPLLIKGLKKEFSYESQGAYFIKKASGWDGIKRLFNEKSQSVGIGFLDRLKKVLGDYAKYKSCEYDFKIEDDYKAVEWCGFNNCRVDKTTPTFAGVNIEKKVLYPEQKDAVNTFFYKKTGIIAACTGGGKTLIAAHICKDLKVKTLFLVDTLDLLMQAKSVFEEVLEEKVGIVGGGENRQDWVTIATIQTLARAPLKFKDLLENTQLVIVDECHVAASKSYVKILKKCTEARYRLGLSATPRRLDGKDMELEESLGNTIYSFKTKDAQEKNYLVDCDIIFHKIAPLCLDNDFREDYQKNIVENNERNNLIWEEATKTLLLDESVLILTKTVDHGKLLHKNIISSYHIHGAVDKKVREEIWNKIRKGQGIVVIATNKIAQKGLDIPPLKMLINAGGDGNDIASIQGLGRVLRKVSGKDRGVYVDFLDGGKFSKKWSKKRVSGLKEEGHDIEIKENKNV